MYFSSVYVTRLTQLESIAFHFDNLLKMLSTCPVNFKTLVDGCNIMPILSAFLSQVSCNIYPVYVMMMYSGRIPF